MENNTKGSTTVERNETILLKTIMENDKKTAERFAKLETIIEQSMNSRFVDNERRIGNNEQDIKVIKDEVSIVKNQVFIGKSKWFDETVKYVFIAIMGYIAVKIGLK